MRERLRWMVKPLDSAALAANSEFTADRDASVEALEETPCFASAGRGVLALGSDSETKGVCFVDGASTGNVVTGFRAAASKTSRFL
jgi:hypothetical protein